MQPIFSRNSDFRKTAFINWRIKNGNDILNIMNMADGYLSSAISLAELCIEDNSDKKADIFIFPILANANHGIELYLKAMTWMLNKLLDSEKRIEGAHNIKQIFQTVRARVKVLNGGLSLKDFNSASDELENYILELFTKIQATEKKDKMDFSRYPIDEKYENHFYVQIKGNVEVDLENFVKRFSTIKNRLGTMSDFLYHHELYPDIYI